VDGRRYDCTGEVENDGLVEFAVREYGDEAPSFWSEIAWDDPVAAKVIRWNTAWTLDVGDFLAALQPTPSPVAR